MALSPDTSHALYEQGREAMAQGDFIQAADLSAQSAAVCPHFKTLELWGECLVRLNYLQKAIVPLAAATALNRGVRAPAILADVFLRLEEFSDAADMVSLALERDTHNRTARAVRDALHEKGHLP